MKRLLVIANLYHASPRIPALMTYLSDFGWEITIVTPELGDNIHSVLGFPEQFKEKVELVYAPYRGDIFWIVRKVLDLVGFSNESSYTEQLKEEVVGGSSWVDYVMRIYQTVVAIPDTEWPWHRSAYHVSRRLLELEEYNVLLSSSPFPTVHRVATRLKKRFKIPWVADFRDPWSQSHNYTLPKIRWYLDRWLELRTLQNADRLITVSHGVAEKLAQLHGDRVDVVRNGYQPIVDRPEVPMPEKFTVSYTGTIYSGKQNPLPVLQAIKQLIDQGEIDASRIVVEFFGRYDCNLQQIIDDLGLAQIVEQKGVLPRGDIRLHQMRSHLLLLFQWEDTEEKGIFPLKFYEYLDARRPILATGGELDSEVAQLIDETRVGSVATNVDEIMRVLMKSYGCFLSNSMSDYCGDLDLIEKYSYLGSSMKLKRTLEGVIPESLS